MTDAYLQAQRYAELRADAMEWLFASILVLACILIWRTGISIFRGSDHEF